MGAFGQHSRAVDEYYQKGISALEKKNYDYAIAMLLQIVLENPLFSEARKKLHQAEREKHAEHPPSLFALIFIKINTIIPLILALFYDARSDSEKAIAFYEDLLKTDHNNKFYLRKIYQCALKKQWIEVAVVALESLFELDQKNADIAKMLGELYRDKQDIEKAAFYFKKSLSLNPANQKVSKSLKDLEALRTIKTGGWEKGSDYRTKIKDGNVAESLEQETKFASPTDKTNAKIARLKDTLSKTPDDLTLQLDLIDAYLDADKLSEAETLLSTTEKQYRNNEYVQNRVCQFKKKRIAKNVRDIEAQLQSDPDNSALLSTLNEHKRELMGAERDALEKKAALYPNDLSLKFELGDAYFYLEDFDKAISEFQHAVKDPALSTKALNKLGLSFQNKGMHDLAVLQFSKALSKMPGMNEFSKELIYNLGATLEAMGKGKEALEEFKKIYEVDISYRDVAQKIENFYQK